MKHFSKKKIWTLAAVLLVVSVGTVGAQGTTLPTPTMELYRIDGNYVDYYVFNTDGAGAEIHLSNDNVNFRLVETVTDGDWQYRELSYKKTYYVKARTTRDGAYSAFSETYTFTTDPEWFPPTISARAINATTVEVTITDRSYLDYEYEIMADEPYDYTYYQQVNLPDSGQSETLYIDNLESIKTYRFYANVYLLDENHTYWEDVASTTIRTPFLTPTLRVDTVGETNVVLYVTNANEGSNTELERSLSPGSGFTVIRSLPDDDDTDYEDYLNDTGLEPNTTYYYRLRAVESPTSASEYSPVVEAKTGTANTLESLVLYDYEVEQTNITFWWTNVNPDSQTEIYRSLSPNDGFTLIAVRGNNTQGYTDRNLKPRTKYYYRLRAIRGDETSEYMALEYTTFSNNYPPTLTARAIDTQTVELTFTDNSYNDLDYTIQSNDESGSPFYETLALSDSGQTVTIIHESATPGATIVYTVDMTVDTYPRDEVQLEGVTTTTITMPKEGSACPGTGSIKREIWYNIPGTTVSSIPVNTPPDQIVTLTSFETENYYGSNYGSRVRGYICPEQTGDYMLFIASDDQSELWLSTDANPANKRKIASVTGHTTKNNFTKYPTQSSGIIQLTRGQKYYVEVLHKEGSGADFLQVGWLEPDTDEEVPIPGDKLIPFDAPPTPVACQGAGGITWDVWRNFTGNLSTVPVNSPPSNTTTLPKFESPQYYANNYASRARGHICVPVTGDYVFYIASDDHSWLALSSDESPANLGIIAEVNGATKFNQWDKYDSQESAPYRLEAGKKYFIQVMHQEVSGNDFIQVGWKMPDGTLERPLPGNRLIPFDYSANQLPVVTINSPQEGAVYNLPATVNIGASVSDPDGTVSKVEFYNGATRLAVDFTAPYSFEWNAPAGNHTIIVKGVDNRGGERLVQVKIAVRAACEGTGQILRQVWFGVAGSAVSDIPINSPSHVAEYITSLETPQYYDNNYGARIRGYLCVPQTGAYTFHISSDDQSELLLSVDEDPANARKIAAVTGHTSFRNYTKYTSQKSAPIQLTAGYRYYVEVLHKEANGNDHVSVAWTLPNGVFENPISGNRLMRIQDVTSAAAEDASVTLFNPTESETTDQMRVYPNPVTTREFKIGLANPGPMDEAKIKIVSVTGAVVKDEIIPCGGDCSEILVRLSESVEPGLYSVIVLQGMKRTSTKLVVK
jgi:hypothetical protein